MKGVSFVTDETHKRRYMQIDLKDVSKYSDETLEDLFDIIVSEARKDEKSEPWESVKTELVKEKQQQQNNYCDTIGHENFVNLKI